MEILKQVTKYDIDGNKKSSHVSSFQNDKELQEFIIWSKEVYTNFLEFENELFIFDRTTIFHLENSL